MQTIEVFDDIKSQYAGRLEDNVTAVKLRMMATICRLISLMCILAAVTFLGAVVVGVWLIVVGAKLWAIIILASSAVISLVYLAQCILYMSRETNLKNSQVAAWGMIAFNHLAQDATDAGAKLRLKKIAHEIQCLETFNPDHPQLESMRNRCRTIHWILQQAGRVSMTYESLFPKES